MPGWTGRERGGGAGARPPLERGAVRRRKRSGRHGGKTKSTKRPPATDSPPFRIISRSTHTVWTRVDSSSARLPIARPFAWARPWRSSWRPGAPPRPTWPTSCRSSDHPGGRRRGSGVVGPRQCSGPAGDGNRGRLLSTDAGRRGEFDLDRRDHHPRRPAPGAPSVPLTAPRLPGAPSTLMSRAPRLHSLKVLRSSGLRAGTVNGGRRPGTHPGWV